MTRIRQAIGFALIAAAALLSGCAGTSGGVRPVIAMDGKSMDVNDPVENGRALLMTGQYGLAVDALSRVLHNEPQNVRALNLLAETYARLHRFDLADRYHAEALAIDPKSVAALNNMGFSYLVRGDKTRAMELFERAAAINADQPVVAANITLAMGGGGESAVPKQVQPAAMMRTPAQDVPISQHVVLVHRTGKLVRLAPGVQLLVTTDAEPTAEPPLMLGALPQSPSATETALPYLTAQTEPTGVDPRTRVLAALQRLLDPSPFGFFPNVDDFNQMWRTTASVPLDPSPFGFFPEVDDFNQMWRTTAGAAQAPSLTVAALTN